MNRAELIVGSSTEALQKCYANHIPIILSKFVPPTEDLYYDDPFAFEGLVFFKERDLWSYLKFVCSLGGLVINHKEPSAVRVAKDLVKIVNTNQSLDIRFDKCYVYQDNKINCDLEIDYILNRDRYKVLDFMKIRMGSHSGFAHLNGGRHFVEDIYLEDSDIICVSYLSNVQINDFEYSDTMARFVTQKVLEEFKAITLPFVDKEQKFRRKLKLEVIKREVLPLETIYYKDASGVINCGRERKRTSK